MISNKVKRNIWLTLAIISLLTSIDRGIQFATGSVQWWSLLSSICITALTAKFYLNYRKQVRRGNLFGRVRMFE